MGQETVHGPTLAWSEAMDTASGGVWPHLEFSGRRRTSLAFMAVVRLHSTYATVLPVLLAVYRT